MADQITNYKCPACTGPLHFVGASGKLECDYCGSSYSVEEIEAIVRGETELDAALSARITAIQKEKAALDRAGEIAGRLRQAHAQFRTLDARPYLDEMQTERVLERDTLPKEHFPWQRFFARLLDGQIYRTLWVLLLPALGFNMLKNSRGGMLFLELLTLGTMFLLEPLLLSRFGTTPGKWLFGLRVTSPDGRKLTYAEGRERTAYLFWYGIRLNLPFFRLYRLYVSYTDEQQGKALPWEDGSEQTIRDHAGWRFAAAAVLAALLLAGGVLRVLLPVGPVYRGELTVAQFAENYNTILRQFGDYDVELDENGRWKEESSFQSNGGTTTVMFNHRLPQLEYQTENGVLTGIVYHAEGGEADSWISIPSGSVMQYALFAFAGAEKGHILLDKPLQTAASELCDSVFSEYHTVVDGVAVDYVYTDTIIDSTRTQYSYTLTLRRVQGQQYQHWRASTPAPLSGEPFSARRVRQGRGMQSAPTKNNAIPHRNAGFVVDTLGFLRYNKVKSIQTNTIPFLVG